jgi:hypothetical protein
VDKIKLEPVQNGNWVLEKGGYQMLFTNEELMELLKLTGALCKKLLDVLPDKSKH